jgi:hypothetical protein
MLSTLEVKPVPISLKNKILTAILEVVPRMVICNLEQVIIWPEGTTKPYSVRIIRPFYASNGTVSMDLEQATLTENMDHVQARRRVRLDYLLGAATMALML